MSEVLVMEYDKQNIFNKIIKGEIECKKIYEDDKILAFHDIYPIAPTHVLVIPKDEYISFDDFMSRASANIIHDFFLKVRKIANDLELGGSGYRLVTNHGEDACQTVPHFHVHILGKRKLGAIASNDPYHGRQAS